MNVELFGTAKASPIESVMEPPRIEWGAATAAERGPVIATLRNPRHRNAIGTHAGGYSVYRALAIAAKTLKPDQLADLTDTAPAEHIGPVSAMVRHQEDRLARSVGPPGRRGIPRLSRARLRHPPDHRDHPRNIDMPEIREAIAAGRIPVDGDIVGETGGIRVVQGGDRSGLVSARHRRALRHQRSRTARTACTSRPAACIPSWSTRPDLKVFLPPIGGTTIYCFGDPQKLGDPNTPLACRVHDECNGSDVFGSDICTCRPYLAHGIEICIEMAQAGGVGLVVYNRKEGRALGEVTKFLVYNARKRQKGGDRPESYFHRTDCVAGVQDMRFQELMPDVLHWLGITRIDRFASMSDMKCDALAAPGHRDRRARADPRRADPARRPRRDRGQEGGRLFRRRQAARRFAGTVGRALDE